MDTTNKETAQADQTASENLASDLHMLQTDFGLLREDVTRLLNSAVGTARHGAFALRDRASDAVEDLTERGHDSLEHLGNKISAQPLFSAAVAFGLGFIVAKLHGRK